jgi:hypothetical protein
MDGDPAFLCKEIIAAGKTSGFNSGTVTECGVALDPRLLHGVDVQAKSQMIYNLVVLHADKWVVSTFTMFMCDMS